MTLDIATLVGDALLAISTVYTAHRARRNGKQLKQIGRLTNGLLDDKIMRAMREVLAEHHDTEIRELLDAIIRHSRDPNSP